MTTLAEPDATQATGTGATPQPPSRSSRGRTTLDRQVVEKIAGQAAAEIGSSSGRSGGFLGIGSNADASARPKVTAHLYDDFADLELALGIAYPGSLRQTSQQVRERVRRTVEQLTGIRVHRVDIDVTFLDLGDASEPTDSARRLR